MRSVLLPLALVAALLLSTAVAGASSKAQQQQQLSARLGTVPTVSELNVTQYLGTWFLRYQDSFLNDTFQNGSYCATATYHVNASSMPNSFSVYNFENHDSVDGPVVTVNGYGYQPAETRVAFPGRLKVVLHGDGASGFAAPYWINKLGPVRNGQYEYAVVTDDFRLTLFLLVRDVARFDALYEARVLAELKADGFDNFLNRPIKVFQGPPCSNAGSQN